MKAVKAMSVCYSGIGLACGHETALDGIADMRGDAAGALQDAMEWEKEVTFRALFGKALLPWRILGNPSHLFTCIDRRH